MFWLLLTHCRTERAAVYQQFLSMNSLKYPIVIKHGSYLWSLNRHLMCHVTQLVYPTGSRIIYCSVEYLLLPQHAGYEAVLWYCLKCLIEELSVGQRLPNSTVAKSAALLLKEIQFHSLTKAHGGSRNFPSEVIIFSFTALLFLNQPIGVEIPVEYKKMRHQKERICY